MSPIQKAIQSAVSKWEREPFYFNQAYNGSSIIYIVDDFGNYITDDAGNFIVIAGPEAPFFTTALGQEFYSVFDSPLIGTAPETGRRSAWPSICTTG